MAETIAILGGAGFVGSSLAIGLKHTRPELEITCIDNLRRRGSELNLPRFRREGISFHHADIRIASDLASNALAADTYIDCSAEPSVLAGYDNPAYVVETNLLGTVNILELARRNRARMMFLSTSRVYSVPALRALRFSEGPTRFTLAADQSQTGASQNGIDERFTTSGQRTLYGTTKLASELLIEEYRASYGVGSIVNRCGVLAGPWQMGKVDQGVFVLWLAAHYFEKPLSYIGYGGSGKQVRDLLHVEDLVTLIHHQLNHFSDLEGSLFNVGGGLTNSLSLLETTELCRELTGKTVPIAGVREERQGDVPCFITDSTQVVMKTGWRPRLDPRKTLTDIRDWIAEHESLLRGIL